MPNLTIYVPRDLAEQLRHHDVKVSRACQTALRRQVRLAERRRSGDGMIAAVDRAVPARRLSDRGGAA